jgi:hypothetical protein
MATPFFRPYFATPCRHILRFRHYAIAMLFAAIDADAFRLEKAFAAEATLMPPPLSSMPLSDIDCLRHFYVELHFSPFSAAFRRRFRFRR